MIAHIVLGIIVIVLTVVLFICAFKATDGEQASFLIGCAYMFLLIITLASGCDLYDKKPKYLNYVYGYRVEEINSIQIDTTFICNKNQVDTVYTVYYNK